MLSSLLPACVATRETRGDPRKHRLFPEEEEIVASSVVERRTEFAAARDCAHSAMAQLGLPPAPLLSGPRGEPQWPHGIVGSITHCRGYRAAAVGRHKDLLSIGIDAEPHLPLPARVIFDIALREERRDISKLLRLRSNVHWDRVHFSAKETVYKSWFPLARTGIDFQHCRLHFDPWEATFNIEIRSIPPHPAVRALTGKSGRWKIVDGLIITALAIGAERWGCRA